MIFQHRDTFEKSAAMATGTNSKIPLSDESMSHTCQNKLVKFRLDILGFFRSDSKLNGFAEFFPNKSRFLVYFGPNFHL